MAMFGHVALGMAVGRAFWERWREHRTAGVVALPERPRMLRAIAERCSELEPWRKLALTLIAGATLATLPDIDLLFGVAPGRALGHRGLTHSLLFALVGGSCVGYFAGFWGLPRRLSMLFAVLALATHGLADTLTDTAFGPALLWPFSKLRVVAPFRPMVRVPLDSDFFGPPGLLMVKRELLLFGAFVVYAWFPRRRPLTAASDLERI